MFVLYLDVSFFSESLEKYNNEHEQAVGILEHRSIGMILVDCKKLKEVLIPSPLKCLEVRRAMLITACLQSFLSAKLFSFKRVSEYISVGKQPLFRNVTGFLVKWRLRIERRNSLLMTCHYLNLSSASDWSCWVRNLHLLIKSTTLFQPPPQALRSSHCRGERETSDWWWTARDHGKGTDGSFPPSFARTFSSKERRLGTRQTLFNVYYIVLEFL